MVDFASVLLGPQVVPECRRSAGRPWIILVRGLAAAVVLVTALGFLWFWWFSAQFDPLFRPYATLRLAIECMEFVAVAIAIVMGPAVMAGSLAGEKERGSLGLLLTTRINALEIVLGRVSGKVCQVGFILLAGGPGLVLVACLAGLGPIPFLTLLALPIAVAIGGVGMAAAASAISRRGRDALLSVYLLILVLLLTPLAASLPASTSWLALANPFSGIGPLAWGEDVGPAASSAAFWLGLGLAGVGLAAWRLRPACLALLSGEASRGRRGRRRWWVPPLDERDPMLWKEVFIERVGTLGKFGRWFGLLVVLALFLTSTILAGLIAYSRWIFSDKSLDDYCTGLLASAIGAQSRPISFLIEVAIGLRAAVAIASERERGTWDALLTSPLQGGEIVLGKLWGSLNSLRWLIAAALWAWVLATAMEAMTPWEFGTQVAATIAVGCFMAAVGVRTSLATSTATRSMAITMGIWLGSVAVISTLVAVLLIFGTIILMGALTAALRYNNATPILINRWIGSLWGYGWPILYPTFYLAATFAIVSECRLRFDRIAGRMAGGKVAVQVDQFFHGTPLPPVLLDPPPAPTAPILGGADATVDIPRREGAATGPA